MRRFGLILLSALTTAASAVASETEVWDDACAIDSALPGSAWLDRIETGWGPLRDDMPGRHGLVNKRENARVIYWAFVDAGYPEAIAYAAIVNSMSESALDNSARMSDVFTYGDLHYPRGTGAIGLFQLLPSRNGAGGPSGPEQGLSELFQGGRWAGTPWQATHHHDVPDGLGRTYYDATDPVLNTQRIILEVERDGDALMAAYHRGASIAHLSYLFGRDIERPSVSTWYRRREAVQMLGQELAMTRHPDRLFAPEPSVVFSDPLDDECLPWHGAVRSKALATVISHPHPVAGGWGVPAISGGSH